MYIHEIKKSKFIAYSFNIDSKNEINEILNTFYKEHKKASHFTYAFIAKDGSGFSDDGEPSGTAGKPLFNLLNLKKHENKLVVVIRYYGGKKLGASGLIRAYINAGKNVL
ncbi:MAG: YigZ family protein [Mycoplasmatales bacterium]|nr:YigZ family protein [Mycoplasmatales bacterium]